MMVSCCSDHCRQLLWPLKWPLGVKGLREIHWFNATTIRFDLYKESKFKLRDNLNVPVNHNCLACHGFSTIKEISEEILLGILAKNLLIFSRSLSSRVHST